MRSAVGWTLVLAIAFFGSLASVTLIGFTAQYVMDRHAERLELEATVEDARASGNPNRLRAALQTMLDAGFDDDAAPWIELARLDLGDGQPEAAADRLMRAVEAEPEAGLPLDLLDALGAHGEAPREAWLVAVARSESLIRVAWDDGVWFVVTRRINHAQDVNAIAQRLADPVGKRQLRLDLVPTWTGRGPGGQRHQWVMRASGPPGAFSKAPLSLQDDAILLGRLDADPLAWWWSRAQTEPEAVPFLVYEIGRAEQDDLMDLLRVAHLAESDDDGDADIDHEAFAKLPHEVIDALAKEFPISTGSRFLRRGHMDIAIGLELEDLQEKRR